MYNKKLRDMTPVEKKFAKLYTDLSTSNEPIARLVKRVFRAGYLAVTGHQRAALVQIEAIAMDPNLPTQYASSVYRIASNCRVRRISVDAGIIQLIEATVNVADSVQVKEIVLSDKIFS